MSSNFIQGSSSSLVIAEGQEQFDVNSSEQKPKNDDDLFDLSKDQPSVSFQVDQERNSLKVRQLCRKSKDDTIQFRIVDAPADQNKKKRKEIFKKNSRSSVISKVEESKGEDNLLNIFDSIFSKKGTDPANFCGVFDMNKEDHSNILAGISMSSRTPSAEKRARFKIFEKKKISGEYGSVLPSNIFEEEQKQPEVAHPSLNNIERSASPIKGANRQDSFNMQSIEKRFSVIQGINQDDSRDSFEIGNILQSQIFRDQKVEEVGMLPIEQKDEESYRQSLIVRQKNSEIRAESIISVPEVIILPTVVSEQKQQACFKKKQALTGQPFLAVSGKSIKSYSSSSFINNLNNITPVSQEQAMIYGDYPMEETKYVANSNDLSSFSSNPSVSVQNYQSRKVIFASSNSMANIQPQHYQQLLTPRTVLELESQPNGQQNSLVQSRIVEDIQKINIAHNFQEEVRQPKFLRQIRKLISVYPNFYILKNNPNTSQTISQEFHTLIHQFDQAIQLLSTLCQKLLDVRTRKKFYLEQIMSTSSYEAFIDSDWHQLDQYQEYELIKPCEEVEPRGWNYQKAKTALSNYMTVVKYYKNKKIPSNFMSEQGKKKYFKIRQKFWDICGNMKWISEDIFHQMRKCAFPPHYYQFLAFLKSQFPVRMTQTRLQYLKTLLNKFRYLKREKDQLVISQIGIKINQKLNLEMQYHNPY